MSEKRFSRKSVEDLIVEKGLDSIVDLLNEQNKKIKKLERENNALWSNVKWFANQLRRKL